MRLFENPKINFVNRRRIGYIVSGVLLTISVISLLTRGLETGIDFQGGTEFVLETSEALPVVEVRTRMGDQLGSDPEVKQFGTPNDLLIRSTVQGSQEEVLTAVTGAFEAAYPEVTYEVVKNDYVGPRFADDLKDGAIQAVIFSLIVIFLYILLRFGEFKASLSSIAFPVGAVAALVHDVTITLGIFSLLGGQSWMPFSLQIDQAIIAAFLTIVGYSLNDTVVIFDRIREYTNLFKTQAYETVVNRSINQTLSRTVVTSLTTFIVVVVLFLFGGEVLKGFSFALIIGVIIGTYSSIFVASPIVVELRKN